MNIMKNYEQKYKEALEQAKKELEVSVLSSGSLDCATARVLFKLFPELQKSEDARIKEELIHFLETCQDPRFVGNRKQEKWIKWLENNPIFGMPKIKFKVGDWVIFKNDKLESVYQVEKIENYAYTLRHILGGSMPLAFYSQDLLRPWNIEDVKDGDILVDESKIFMYKWHINNEIGFYASFSTKGENNLLFDGVSFGTLNTIKNIYPAAKEQRDLLFQKIKEAGYKWDTDSKRFNWICD